MSELDRFIEWLKKQEDVLFDIKCATEYLVKKYKEEK